MSPGGPELGLGRTYTMAFSPDEKDLLKRLAGDDAGSVFWDPSISPGDLAVLNQSAANNHGYVLEVKFLEGIVSIQHKKENLHGHIYHVSYNDYPRGVMRSLLNIHDEWRKHNDG
jgi:hypothetical protein